MGGELPGQGIGDLLVAGPVDGAHLAEVAGEQALVDEAGQRPLEGQGGVPVGQVLGRPHGRAQRGWHHDEAQAQGGQGMASTTIPWSSTGTLVTLAPRVCSSRHGGR